MADNTSSTAANKETTADNLLQLPSDVLRKVAAFTFAAPSRKSCSIEFDGQKKRRDALEGSRHASALVVAIPKAEDKLRRELRADLDKAEQARGFGYAEKASEKRVVMSLSRAHHESRYMSLFLTIP